MTQPDAMPDAMPTSSYAAWEETLDWLERELDRAEAPDASEHEEWTPPAGLGPIPSELLERATRVLSAQRAVMARLDTERQETGRHLAALRSVPTVTDAAASVYLDVDG